MSVRLENDLIRLEGACHVEDAEELLALLQAEPSRTLDLTKCSHLHAAIVQVLLVFRPSIRGSCYDPFIRDWLLPCLGAAGAGIASNRSFDGNEP